MWRFSWTRTSFPRRTRPQPLPAEGSAAVRAKPVKPLPDLAAVVLWMAGALLSFSATAIAVRELAPALGLFDILAARAAAGVAIVGAVALLRRRPLAARRLRLHLARNLVHWGGNYAWSYGVTLLPLAVVFALEFTTPAWVTLLAVLILRERLTASRVAAVALGFLGVLVVLRPGLAALQPASLVVLAAAVMFALTASPPRRSPGPRACCRSCSG